MPFTFRLSAWHIALTIAIAPVIALGQSKPKIYLKQITPLVPIEQSVRQSKPGALELFSVDKQAADKSGIPVPLHIGLPLVQTKGIVLGKGVLYIADTGKDGNHKEPAKIWKFDLTSKSLSKLYEGPLLVNSKWIFYRKATGANLSGELFVSDYGVETIPRDPGTGEGAKVFVISLDLNGDALDARILHAGAPFRSPEGISVVGDTVLVADWASGPLTTLGDRPGQFNRGQLFSLPVSGGTPTPLFQEQTFVTLIGVNQYWGEDGNRYIRLIDIDGGRPHTDGAYLQQSGIVAHFRARILSEKPLILGRLERLTIRELVPVELATEGIKPSNTIEIELHDGSLFPNGSAISRFKGQLKPTGTISFTAQAVDSQTDLKVTTRILSGSTIEWEGIISAPKQFSTARPMDPKDAVIPDYPTTINSPRMTAFADGTSSGLYLMPASGGVPATLWRGAPFSQPMGVKYSLDGSSIYMTDQAAGPDGTSAIFEIPLPSRKARASLFPELKLQKLVPLKALSQ